MPQIADTSINLSFFIAIIAASISTFFLTRVIKIEHDEFPAQWKKDGSPHGLPFWFPMKEGRMEKFGVSPWLKGYRWLFKTPDWVKTHGKASKILGYYRLTQSIAFFALLVIFVILLVFIPK